MGVCMRVRHTPSWLIGNASLGGQVEANDSRMRDAKAVDDDN